MNFTRQTKGFTIVELLIVIVIVGVLASITVIAYGGIQDRARLSKMKSDIALMQKAILMARTNEQKILSAITLNGMYGSDGMASACNAHPTGTDLAALPPTDQCWVGYRRLLENVSVASGINIRGILDPWGRPYSVAEQERAPCGDQDQIWAFSYPYASWGGRITGTQVNLPFSDYAC